MAVDAITIHLPGELYRRLERLAALTHQPLEGLIVKTLSSSLPPLPDDLSPDMRDALARLEPLTTSELQQIADDTLPDTQYARLTELRNARHKQSLTNDEQSELDDLIQHADMLMLKKAYAAVLLNWRGQRLAPPTTPHGSSDNALE